MRPHNKKHNTCGDSKMNLPSYYSKDTRVRDKKRLEKVGNLVKNSYLYR